MMNEKVWKAKVKRQRAKERKRRSIYSGEALAKVWIPPLIGEKRAIALILLRKEPPRKTQRTAKNVIQDHCLLGGPLRLLRGSLRNDSSVMALMEAQGLLQEALDSDF